MNLDDRSHAEAIGKILGYLLLANKPVVIEASKLGTKLQLDPEQITAALYALEEQERIKLTVIKAQIELIQLPVSNLIDDAEWEKATAAQIEEETKAKRGAK